MHDADALTAASREIAALEIRTRRPQPPIARFGIHRHSLTTSLLAHCGWRNLSS